MTDEIEKRMQSREIMLPEAFNPTVARLLTADIHRGVLRVSGQTPRRDGKLQYIGKVGREFDVGEGQKAARLAALNVVAQAKRALDGDLDRIIRILNLRGFVNAMPEFTQISETVNGASEVMLEIFGETLGMHTRTAIGAAVMPFDVAIEIEATFAVIDARA